MLVRDHATDGVLTLTLDDPDKRNALGYEAVGDLVGALREADGDPSVRCVLITARGRVFSAGADLAEFQRELTGSAADFYESGAVWEELFTFAPTMGTPIVAAVNGAVRAGATGLVALADLVVAGESATFGLTEIRIGLFPIMVLPMVIRVVGFRAAQDLALTGRVVDAHEAHTMGLVTTVVGDDALVTSAREVAAGLATSAPTALAHGRRLLSRLADMNYDEAVHHARTMRGVFLHTDDIREGVAAFLDKREPAWSEPEEVAS